ncbi:MAG TPA: multiheme c-type cytochrome [Acidobacteriaceae bacterium]|nr:multiheme c-type cytochrome [Acidobacteriaceae bacterium]
MLCAAAWTLPGRAQEMGNPQPVGPQAASQDLHTPPPASAYAGDAACAECHAVEARGYFTTPHYHDSSAATRKTILGDFTPGKNVLKTPNPDLIFAMIQAPDGFYQSAVDIANPEHLTGEAQKFDIVIGSGRRGQTYLYWKGDELYELPVTYWTETNEWINSPGYIDGGVHFDRPIYPRCLECHATTFQTAPPPANKYQKDSLVLGIGCEKCHGPGAEHVEREKSAHPPAAGSAQIAIVNPARLPHDRQMDVCALCHAGAGMPLTASQSFRPGDDLAKYLTVTMPPPDAPVDVHGNQVQALEHSKCFTSGKLTCATCHNVHAKQETADSFSSHCLTCHTVQTCPRFKQMGEAIRTKCIECHMPLGRSQALTSQSEGKLLRAHLRQHRIAIYPDATATGGGQ